MNKETGKIAVPWTHNSEIGTVIGILITEPDQMKFMMEVKNELIVSAFIVDSCKRKWRVRANAHLASQLSSYFIGQKIKITGTKGNLCKGAWDDAKRQIVPSLVELKNDISKIRLEY